MSAALLALDIDGTIVTFDGVMSERVKEAILAADAAGHHVVIATGRSVYGAVEVAHRIGLEKGWLVCSNGAVIVELDPEAENGWRLTQTVTFDPKPALDRMRAVLPAALIMVEDEKLHRWTTGEFPTGEIMSAYNFHVVPFEDLPSEAVRIVLRDPESTAEAFAAAIETIGLHGVTYSVGWSNWLDIAPEGVSKASALETVREWLDVEAERTFCAGDGENDMEMMAWAHRGVAMGQAVEQLKDIATEVTGTVEDDGLADALEVYGRTPVR